MYILLVKMVYKKQHVSTQLRGHHQVGIMKVRMAVHKLLASLRDPVGTPTIYLLPFSLLLYQRDDDPLVGLKHVAFINHFNQ
jgi:hypothetical protein